MRMPFHQRILAEQSTCFDNPHLTAPPEPSRPLWWACFCPNKIGMDAARANQMHVKSGQHAAVPVYLHPQKRLLRQLVLSCRNEKLITRSRRDKAIHLLEAQTVRVNVAVMTHLCFEKEHAHTEYPSNGSNSAFRK